MKTVTLKSGATLEVQEAPFLDAWNLTQAVAAELAKSLPGLKLEGTDEKQILEHDMDIGKIMSVVAQMMSSKSVFELVWVCMRSCVYNGQRIERTTFEEPSARVDFLPTVVEVFKVNVLPFIKGLDLRSLTASLPAQKPKSQK